MMENQSEFLNLPKDKFRTAANKLLNECFLLKKSKDTSADYLYVLNNRDAFCSFFDLLGYELNIVEEYGVISLNNPAGTGRIHLKKIESILLLILRLLYIEKRKQLSQIEDVIIVADEIYDKYNMLKIAGRLDKTTMRNSLGLFKRYHLISNLDSDMSSPDTRIKIWPSILFAVTTESLDTLYSAAKEKLDKYATGGDNDGSGNDAENEETNEN